MKETFLSKITNTGDFTLKSDTLTKNQSVIFWCLILLSVIIKVILIPYNMMDMGDSATRVWNALWWAQNPFFVLPDSGHPFWFYFMGPIIAATNEIFYTPILTMIILMSLAGVYLFKIALLLSDFKTAILSFFIFTLNPVIFRLNFEPYAQQAFLTSICIMAYFFIKANVSEKSKKNFTIAGIFSFLALASRPEAIFILLPFCILALLSRREGSYFYIILSLLFQLLWLVISQIIYDTPFRTFQGADQYTDPINIQTLNIGLRLKGFFLPYYFLLTGLTIILFYFFIKGTLYSIKNYPKIIILFLFIPILVPALINGIASVKSSIYHTTHYIYLMFFFSPIFTAFGLRQFMKKFSSIFIQTAAASILILTCIPLSYVKEIVPQEYNKLFPKVIQFIVTADEPEETRKLITFIDDNINNYPSLIFDNQDNESSIFYVPFRTKLAPPEKILITGYNVPADKQGLKEKVIEFMEKNKRGIVMVRKNKTTLNEIFTTGFNSLDKKQETEKWVIYTYSEGVDTHE